MNQELIKEVVEIVKTINFNGELSSETLNQVIPQVTQAIMPYMYFLKISQMAISFAWATSVVVSAFLICKAIIRKVEE